MVQFEDRKAPERQEINVTFECGETEASYDAEELPSFVAFLLSRPRFNFIAYRIEHTARTWAADIDALLSSHVRNVGPKNSAWRKFLSKNASFVGMLVFAALALTGAKSVESVAELYYQNAQQAFHAQIDVTREVSDKIRLLGSWITSMGNGRVGPRVIPFFFIWIIVSFGLALWTGTAIRLRNLSFLRLTKKSEEYRELALRKKQHRILLFFAGLIISIITGVCGNYIFAYLIGQWEP